MNETVEKFLESHAPVKMADDCFTLREAMKKWTLSETHTRRKLARLLDDGIIEKIKGVTTPDGGFGTVYRSVVK